MWRLEYINSTAGYSFYYILCPMGHINLSWPDNECYRCQKEIPESIKLQLKLLCGK